MQRPIGIAVPAAEAVTAWQCLTRRHVHVLVHVGFASQGKSHPVCVLVAVHELIEVALAEGIEKPGPLKHVCKAFRKSRQQHPLQHPPP